jgi:hypothetical protein
MASIDSNGRENPAGIFANAIDGCHQNTFQVGQIAFRLQ